MYKKLLPFALFMAGIGLHAQTTATDFTATDCASGSHHLFADLNEGKVVVICWVMPCGTCIGPALTITTALEAYATSHPGKVIFYMVDDYGNTACSTLESWASANGIKPDATFSNTAVSMADYGAAGMPKTVVIGGGDHGILLNNNGTLSESTLKTAIDAAIVSASVKKPASKSLGIYPNPANTGVTNIQFDLDESAEVKIQVRNITGAVVKEISMSNQPAGSLNYTLSMEGISTGLYSVSLHTKNASTEALLTIQ